MKEKDKRTKPPAMPQGTGFLSLQDQEAAAPASSHSTKRKTPAAGREAQEAAASSRSRTKSTTSLVLTSRRQFSKLNALPQRK